MSGLTQWAVVAVIVALCAAYAVKVLLPRAARQALAKWLARRGFAKAAARVDAAGGGCGSCPSNASRPAPRR